MPYINFSEDDLYRAKTSTNPNVNLVLETVRAAKSLVAVPLTLHSDQGFQYTSHEYNKLTENLGITQSMSRRGNPYDNALAENFFSILKTECIHRVKDYNNCHRCYTSVSFRACSHKMIDK